ncbi:hypothetical protein ACVR1I_03470 [Streptococcus cameli]
MAKKPITTYGHSTGTYGLSSNSLSKSSITPSSACVSACGSQCSSKCASNCGSKCASQCSSKCASACVSACVSACISLCIGGGAAELTIISEEDIVL